MELYYNKSKVVAVTGMAFPVGDVNNFVVGSEEGTVYTASRHGRWVYSDVLPCEFHKILHFLDPVLVFCLCSKAGISEMFEGHQGPVTGISCHNAVGPIDFSNLFTTSSFDWTAKLWSTKVWVVFFIFPVCQILM